MSNSLIHRTLLFLDSAHNHQSGCQATGDPVRKRSDRGVEQWDYGLKFAGFRALAIKSNGTATSAITKQQKLG